MHAKSVGIRGATQRNLKNDSFFPEKVMFGHGSSASARPRRRRSCRCHGFSDGVVLRSFNTSFHASTQDVLVVLDR